jgi:hypothetical protein
MKNLGLDHVFPSQEGMKAVMESSSFEFAPGLLGALTSRTGPTIAYFKTLPLHLEKLWAIYLIVLEKAGHRPRIYIGSGTCSETGVRKRINTYNRRSKNGVLDSGIPQYVETSLQEGYAITHQCLLAWTDLPLASERFHLRCFFLILETVFALMLWAMKSRTKDYFMPALCPWLVESLTYDGCCTHFSINEGVTGMAEDLPPDEINRLAAEKKLENGRKYTAAKGPGVHVAQSKASRDKAMEEQKHVCDVCVRAFPNQYKLTAHLGRRIHAKKVQQKAEGFVQLKKKNWCEPCQYEAADRTRPKKHLNGQHHFAMLRLLANKANKSSSELD